MGYDPVNPLADVHVVAQMVGEPSGFASSLTVRDPLDHILAERVLHSPGKSCEPAFKAMVLALSLALEAFVPPTPAPGRQPVPLRTKLEQPDSEPKAFVGELSMGVAALAGIAPAVTGLAMLEGNLHLASPVWASVGVGALASLPSTMVVQQGSIDTQLLAAGLHGCGRRKSMFGCAVFQGGAFLARAEGLTRARTTTTGFLSGGLRAAYRVNFGDDAGVVLFGEAGAVLISTVVRVGQEEVWRTSPVYGGVGAMLAFGGKHDT